MNCPATAGTNAKRSPMCGIPTRPPDASSTVQVATRPAGIAPPSRSAAKFSVWPRVPTIGPVKFTSIAGVAAVIFTEVTTLVPAPVLSARVKRMLNCPASADLNTN